MRKDDRLLMEDVINHKEARRLGCDVSLAVVRKWQTAGLFPPGTKQKGKGNAAYFPGDQWLTLYAIAAAQAQGIQVVDLTPAFVRTAVEQLRARLGSGGRPLSTIKELEERHKREQRERLATFFMRG